MEQLLNFVLAVWALLVELGVVKFVAQVGAIVVVFIVMVLAAAKYLLLFPMPQPVPFFGMFTRLVHIRARGCRH